MSEQTLIATTPAGMQAAQEQMIAWCDTWVEAQKLEIADLERTIAEAQRASIKDVAWKARLGLARRKMTFYRKVKAALMKGYYIVPPFPVQLFALRIPEGGGPPRGLPATWRKTFEQKPRLLSEGEGRWKSPRPEVVTWTEQTTDIKGNPRTDRYFEPSAWGDVDFPFKLAKPEIIAAVRGAMEDKIFDALGVLPQRRDPDPIVVGQLFPPHDRSAPLTFFVAWWLDTRDL